MGGCLKYDGTNFGYTIVLTYSALYGNWIAKHPHETPLYNRPIISQLPSERSMQYRGSDRDSLSAYNESDNLAEIYLFDLEKSDERNDDGLVFREDEALKALSYCNTPENYEIIWQRIYPDQATPPKGYISAGFEPTWFPEFSALCDCIHFMRWHGTDKEGVLFQEHFKKLNKNGLFNSPEDAQSFIEYYLSFDWTEHGEYGITEIFVKDSSRQPA